MELQFENYKPEYQLWFEKLNKAWLEEYFRVEEVDRYVLEQSEDAILKKGGHIFFAKSAGQIVGTVALRFVEDGVFELTKMAVLKSAQGSGAGQFICRSAILKAKELGASKVILYTNSILKNALHIYCKLGFLDIPLTGSSYSRSDTKMELLLNEVEGGFPEEKSFTEADIKRLRGDTEGTKRRIHFNNAGASLPPAIVVDTVINYLKEESVYGGYETEDRYQKELENVYHLIAQFIHADKSEIALVENASQAWGIAFNGMDWQEGDEVITSEMEYVTNVIGLIHAQKAKGVKMVVIANDTNGNFSIKALEEAITPRTKLIAITHIPSTAGNILPVAEIGDIACRHGIVYLLDACQSVGHFPLNVNEIGCDMLAATGRKYLRAPRGTGFLYVRKSVQDRLKPYFMDGFSAPRVSETDFTLRNDARRFELYERSRALTLGLGKAVEYAMEAGIKKIWERIQVLSFRLRSQLSKEEILVHDTGDHLTGIVTFSVKGMGAEKVHAELAKRNINVSIGKAESTLFYMNRHAFKKVIRASVHYYNTEEEIDSFCEILRVIQKENVSPELLSADKF